MIDLAHSRDIWRRMACSLEAARNAVMATPVQFEIVESADGKLWCVCYGKHGFPVSVEPMVDNESFRPHALLCAGDVTMLPRDQLKPRA